MSLNSTHHDSVVSILVSGILICAVNIPVAHAATVLLVCPDSIASVQSTSAIAGWEAYDRRPDGKHLLRGAGFTNGPPKELAALRPEITQPTKKITKNTYLVESSSASGAWLECAYSDTRIVLTQRLPAGIDVCEITYTSRPVHPEPLVRSIVCK